MALVRHVAKSLYTMLVFAKIWNASHCQLGGSTYFVPGHVPFEAFVFSFGKASTSEAL